MQSDSPIPVPADQAARRGNELSGPAVGRLTLGEFWRDFRRDLLELDRGLPFTLMRMLGAPGTTLRAYLAFRDPRMLRPFRYFVVVVGLTALADIALGFSAEFVRGFASGWNEGSRTTLQQQDLLDTVENYRLLMLLAVVPLLSVAIGVGFRAHRTNLAERWVVSLYLVASGYLLGTLGALLLARAAGLPDADVWVLGLMSVHFIAAMRGLFGIGLASAVLRAAISLLVLLPLLGIAIAVPLGVYSDLRG